MLKLPTHSGFHDLFLKYNYIRHFEYQNSLHNKLFNLPARRTCSNGIFTSPPWNLQVPPYQDNFVQGLDQRLK
jgi:hypothetical protein